MVRLIIEVSGGLVSAVHVDKPYAVDVTVLDWDAIEAGDRKPKLPRDWESWPIVPTE